MITILGPTATGKTELAALTAFHLNGEIISADSRQVYRGMDLGTGKDYDSFFVNGVHIPYHLIDICEPGEEYNIFRFRNDFFNCYNAVLARGKTPVLCGGTGFYIESILTNYRLEDVPENHELRSQLNLKTNEELIDFFSSYKIPHNTTDTKNRERLIRAIEIQYYYNSHPEMGTNFQVHSINFGVFYEREVLRQRIKQRLTFRLENGMINEVETLISRGVSISKLLYYGLEYKYIALYLSGELSYNEMSEKLFFAICQFSKRQMTWFRKMEKNGVVIHWINGELTPEEKFRFIQKCLK